MDEVLEGLPEIEEADEEEEETEVEAEEGMVPGGAEEEEEEREDSLLADLADFAAEVEAAREDGPITVEEPVKEGSKKEDGPIAGGTGGRGQKEGGGPTKGFQD